MEKNQSVDQSSIISEEFIIDTMVSCVMCEIKMHLSQLVAHQKQCQSRPTWKTQLNARDHERCIFCINHPWVPKTCMNRHLRRKHPNELPANKTQPANQINKTEKCEEAKMEKMITSKIESSSQRPTLQIAETTRVLRPVDASRPRFNTPKVYPSLRIERDMDGFDELVLRL